MISPEFPYATKHSESERACHHRNFEGFKDDHNEECNAQGIAATECTSGSPILFSKVPDFVPTLLLPSKHKNNTGPINQKNWAASCMIDKTEEYQYFTILAVSTHQKFLTTFISVGNNATFVVVPSRAVLAKPIKLVGVKVWSLPIWWLCNQNQSVR